MKSLTKILFAVLMLTGITRAFADTQDRRVSGFRGIDVAGSFDVFITQGSTESVRVEAPSDEIDRIKTEVVDGVLKIYNKRGDWNFNLFGDHKKRVVYVNAKMLDNVSVSGSGDVSFKNGLTTNALKIRVSGSGDVNGRVEVKELEAGISGSGDVRLSGHAARATIGVSGSGDFRGSELITGNTAVRVSGSGDATVNANERIDASVSGSGDIRYTGNAKSVSTSKSGSGEIHRM